MTQTARERFVVAIRSIYETHAPCDVDAKNCSYCCDVRQAVEAFEDAECEFQEGDASCMCREHKHDHIACRAALLKEIGL